MQGAAAAAPCMILRKFCEQAFSIFFPSDRLRIPVELHNEYGCPCHFHSLQYGFCKCAKAGIDPGRG